MSDYEKPSKAEDEYFARQEIERRKKWAQEQRAKLATDEVERLRQTHWMKCPKCGHDLATMEMHGVSVDHCAHCGGVFLDKGELETLLQHDQGITGKILSIFK